MKQEKNIWEQSRVELFQKLDCRETGLSQEDAADRLAKYGANELHAGKQKSVLQIFLGQFADFLVLILILAAVISACTGDVESMIVILAVITMNAILGTVQTVKASASLDSLKQMSAPTAKVLRDGQIVQIPGREVVPGDVVILEAGDSVCADGRLLECASLKCAESALTGESLPVEKDTEPLSGETALGDRKNMVFSGSFVTYGRGRFLVTATGMDTEMGKIAQLLKNTEERKTPLQVSLDQFGRKLSIIILVICAVLFGVSVLWRHENVMNAFLFAVALAVEKSLTQRGATVLMTRRTDTDLCDDTTRPANVTKKRQDMQCRVDMAVQGQADMVLSIHMNEYRVRSESGPQVFYRAGSGAGRLLAGTMQEALITALSPQKERAAMPGDYFILQLDTPSVLVECGFISNSTEEALLLSPAYQEKLGEAIADGAAEYFRLAQAEK